MLAQNSKSKMTSKFPQIVANAKADKELKFTSLIHHINEELLWSAALELKADKATGIDQVSVEDYLSNGSANIANLLARLKSKTYKAKPVRRVFILNSGEFCS